MIKAFKTLKRKLDDNVNNLSHERDSDGRVVINMRVMNDDGFLSPFSPYDNPVLSDDVTDFLDKTTKSVLPNEQLCLKIKSNCIDDEEKSLYSKAIKETYAEEYLENERALKRNTAFSVVLGLLGVTVLILLFIFESTVANAIWGEVIDILAWVLLWEAFDLYIFGSQEFKLKRLRCLAFISMKVDYIDEK